MADIKPYERYKKDKRNQPKKHNIDNYTDFQKALLAAIESQTEPKKPVKWFFGKDEKDVGWSTLASQFPVMGIGTPAMAAHFMEFKDKEGKPVVRWHEARFDLGGRTGEHRAVPSDVMDELYALREEMADLTERVDFAERLLTDGRNKNGS